ncbi:MAG: hypothetical protein IJQ12_06010 [Lachnospiraceae bacterium]|nr:hypothetical protein [Lachnospiraceae bacterium]
MEELRNEPLNLRLFYLRLTRRLWLIGIGVLLGAVIGGILYTAVTKVTRPEMYRGEARFYLHFVENGTQDTVYDYYNAYTWHELIEADTMMGLLTERLAEAGVSLSEEEIKAVLDTELPSDTRLLHVFAVSSNRETVTALIEAVEEAMPVYGEINEVFRSIEVTETIEPFRVTYPERFGTAVFCGAVLGGIAALFAISLMLLFDDAVYVPEQIRLRHDLHVLGILNSTVFAEEKKENLARFCRGAKSVRLLADPKEVNVHEAGEEIRALLPDEIKNHLDFVSDGSDADCVIVLMGQGKENGTMHFHLTDEARQIANDRCAAMLSGVSDAFLRRYYRIR